MLNEYIMNLVQREIKYDYMFWVDIERSSKVNARQEKA